MSPQVRANKPGPDVSRGQVPYSWHDNGCRPGAAGDSEPVHAGPKLVGPIVSANLATIGAPDRERQILDAQETARKTGLPTPAPQFTVLQW